MARLICAWCGVVLGTAGSKHDSHGICKPCSKRELQRLDEWKRGEA